MSATTSLAPSAPTIAVDLPGPSSAEVALPPTRTTLRIRTVLTVVLAWTVAVLSATSYVEAWRQRNPRPTPAGATLVRHP